MARRVRSKTRLAPAVWRPQPGPQRAFVKSPHFEVVYGGARGGGKTDASLGEFAAHAERCGAAAKGLFVRRTRMALEPTIERAKEIYRPLGVKWQAQKSRFAWPSGALLYFSYINSDNDAEHYQGHSYTRVYVEELTQFADPRPIDKLTPRSPLRRRKSAPLGNVRFIGAANCSFPPPSPGLKMRSSSTVVISPVMSSSR